MQEIGGRMRPVNIASGTPSTYSVCEKLLSGNDHIEDAYGILEPANNTIHNDGMHIVI